MGRRITLGEDEMKALAEQYNRGASIRAIGDLRGWSYGTAHRYLRIAATYGLLTVRTRGGRAKTAGAEDDARKSR